MKRFGSISPFVEHGSAERRIGRLVANHDFIKALLRHGSFDEYVLANPSVANQRTFLEVVDSWGLDAARRARVRPVALVDLPGHLSDDAFHVFHAGGWGAFLPGLHRLRAPLRAAAVPHHRHDLLGPRPRDARLRRPAHPRRPHAHDGIACLSRDGRDAFARLLDSGGARWPAAASPGSSCPLPLGVDDDLVDAAGDREAGRRRLQMHADTIALLVLGRITPAQKMDLAPLLRTFAREILPRAARPLVLVVAGGASDADAQLLHSLDRGLWRRASTCACTPTSSRA